MFTLIILYFPISVIRSNEYQIITFAGNFHRAIMPDLAVVRLKVTLISLLCKNKFSLENCFKTSVTKLKYVSNVSLTKVLDLYKSRTHMRKNGTWMALLAIKPLAQGQQSITLSTDSPLTRQRNLRNQLTSRHEGKFFSFFNYRNANLKKICTRCHYYVFRKKHYLDVV